MNDHESLYEEIVSVLFAELECAESLEATSNEVKSLLEEDKFEQVQERLFARGEIIELIVSLDRKLEELIGKTQPDPYSEEWMEIRRLIGELRDFMKAIIGLDSQSTALLTERCSEIENRLRELQTGKKAVREYHGIQPVHPSKEYNM